MEPHVALERPGPSVILDLPDLPATMARPSRSIATGRSRVAVTDGFGCTSIWPTPARPNGSARRSFRPQL